MTLEDYRIRVPWTKADLARAAAVGEDTVARAENGEWITVRTATILAATLSKALGETIKATEIDGLKIKGVTKVS
jgi:DNA-binding XRE family transcriptional regulator